MNYKKTGIAFNEVQGTWRVVDTKTVWGDEELWLVEREYDVERFEETVAPMVVTYGAEKIIVQDAANGWEDLPNEYELIKRMKGALPSRVYGAGPLIYNMRDGSNFCNTCAAEHTDEIDDVGPYYEGAPIECDNGCGTFIESAYGDPEVEEEEQIG